VKLQRPFTLSRRAALKGLGALVALPMLEAMSRPARAQSAPSSSITRLMFFYVPCGIRMDHFTPTTAGRNWELTPILEPLSKVKDSVVVLSGARNMAAFDLGDGGGDHARGTGAFLTAVHPLKSETKVQNGPSVDQVAAGFLKGKTRLPSLELGCESGSGVGTCDTGYSCAYAHNISWASPTVPMPKEVNPRAVFDRLFTGAEAGLTEEARAARRRRRRSVLDFVQDDTKRLQQKLGAPDRRKLDEYLTGVRELEQRIDQTSTTTCSFPERPQGADTDVETYVHQMLDLAVLALQCDLTRVATFMLGNAGSNRSYRFLGHPGGHHEYSHHQGDEKKLAALSDIGRWEVKQYAYLLEKMAAVQEADGKTLLDNALVYFSSEIEDGNTHGHENMPVLLGGTGGGAVASGRHVKVDAQTDVGDVFLTMLRTVGVEAASFGDYGTRVVPELLAG
jgi:hypothetical protein